MHISISIIIYGVHVGLFKHLMTLVHKNLHKTQARFLNRLVVVCAKYLTTMLVSNTSFLMSKHGLFSGKAHFSFTQCINIKLFVTFKPAKFRKEG